ncbi:MAG: OBAP family protein [Gemmataceae bacterium]|nr:OBAP family protein [Gemmataceae bacterium]
MDRRELLAALGALGASAAAADDHAAKKDAGPASPMAGPHAHFCGIHMAKLDPKLQFVTQHYCAAHTGDHGGDALFQCVLFDGTGKNARLVGVEYLISDRMYKELPEAEKKYWHAHTYEVLGGGLIAPGMPPADELAFMKMVLTTWGKAWHTWPDPKNPVPMGEPMLIWSLMGNGQVDPKVLAARDKEFKVDTAKIAAERQKEFGLALPDVSLPKGLDTIGRQWTNTGPDQPTKRK